MPNVDLYGNDAGRLRSAYSSKIGREARQDELEGWLGGSFGGGGIDDWLRQIENSGEAQEYRSRSQPPAEQQPDWNIPTLGPGPNESRPMVPQNQQDQPPPSWNAPPPQWNEQAWADATRRIQQAYQDIGQTASNDDAFNWLTGAHGYAPGGQGSVDQFVNAIRGIGGLTNQPTTTQTPYQNTQWWNQQGVPDSQIFNPQTGQLLPGWERTGRGYERTSGGTGTGGNLAWGPMGDNPQQWFLNTVTAGLAPSGRNLESLGPRLQQYGIRLGPRNAQGMIDTIVMPDGSRWDVIESATMEGGTRWHWQPAGAGGGGFSTNPNVGGQNFNYGGNAGFQFNDPYTNQFERMLQARLDELNKAVIDPLRQQYADAMQRRADALGKAEPDYDRLLTQLRTYRDDLQGPGYTGAENEVIRTQALDPVERDRTAARQRMAEQLGARGLTPDSGVYIAAMREVDTAFDQMRAGNQNQLAMNDIARRDDRSQRSNQIATQLVDIPQARQREQLDVFGALEQLSNLVRQEEEGRRREAIGYGGVLSELGPNRLQLAMQAAGMGGSPQNMVSSLLGVANMNQNQNLINSRNSSARWSALGSMAAMIPSLFSGGGGGWNESGFRP